MALVSGRLRRAQIATAALVPLVVAASAGIGQGEAVGASVRSSPSTRASEPQAAVVFSSDVVRGLEALRENEPATPPQEVQPGSKVIHLTFDDGPSAHTKPVLRLLDRYDAEATFFQVGENIAARPELVRAVVRSGHAVGSHTWSHRDMRRLKPGRLDAQITRTSRVLGRVTGQPVTCLRPPYGAANRRVRSAVRDHELALKLWDIDTRDWRKPGADVIARRVTSRARPGAVVLMHDGGGNRAQTVRALGRILRTLDERGYDFRTLPGC